MLKSERKQQDLYETSREKSIFVATVKTPAIFGINVDFLVTLCRDEGREEEELLRIIGFPSVVNGGLYLWVDPATKLEINQKADQHLCIIIRKLSFKGCN